MKAKNRVTQSCQIRIDLTLFRKYRKLAAESDRSMNAQIERALREQMNQYEAAHGEVELTDED